MQRPPSDAILAKRLESEAERNGESIEEARHRALVLGLDTAKRAREQQTASAKLAVDILLVTATITEHSELRAAAEALGLSFDKRRGRIGPYYHLGLLGTNRVASMQVAMGSFGPRGSAASCIHARAETRATTIILLGTAYGVDRASQRIGDVLVSESVFLYEDRHVTDAQELEPLQRGSAALLSFTTKLGAAKSNPARWLAAHARPRYIVQYPTTARRRASAAWVHRFRGLADEFRRTGETERIIVGTLLSGGARIESGRFRDDLIAATPAVDPPIVGGEMEAVGVVSSSPSSAFDESGWIVVKGIADFADSASRAKIEHSRGPAARSAARAVLRALLSPAIGT